MKPMWAGGYYYYYLEYYYCTIHATLNKPNKQYKAL